MAQHDCKVGHLKWMFVRVCVFGVGQRLQTEVLVLETCPRDHLIG